MNSNSLIDEWIAIIKINSSNGVHSQQMRMANKEACVRSIKESHDSKTGWTFVTCCINTATGEILI